VAVVGHDQEQGPLGSSVVESVDERLELTGDRTHGLGVGRRLGADLVGDVVNVIPNHCCVVSNMVDEVYGVRGEQVEVVWRVGARGAVR
jgi:D-serine deaminase-like pyridoxal phosphate-dependent protein